MAKLITAHDGKVRSFDGDRVMGIFIGGRKHTNAATCALKMKYTVDKILRPSVEAKYWAFKEKGFVIRHCAGVAKSEVLVVRGGVRGRNDLVFIGSAPNIAAKLSELRTSPYNTWITWSVYSQLQDSAKLGSNGENMWVADKKLLAGVEWDLYKSTWRWKP
jgi:class 3 adenylate cyclase